MSQQPIEPTGQAESIIGAAQRWRRDIPGDLHEHVVEAIYAQAAHIADRAVSTPDHAARPTLDRTLDHILTSKLWGFPIMILLFAVMLWITITGANVPSGWLSSLLIEHGHPWLRGLFVSMGAPWWLTGFVADGIYLATAWVISVMLPILRMSNLRN